MIKWLLVAAFGIELILLVTFIFTGKIQSPRKTKHQHCVQVLGGEALHTKTGVHCLKKGTILK